MSDARGRANRKLYHAAILTRMLEAELAQEQYPASVVLEAAGPAIRGHLLDAYGWFLLELAEVIALPERPPHSVAELAEPADGQAVELAPDSDWMRGELIELKRLEQSGWLAALQAPVPTMGSATPGFQADNLLAVTAQEWSLEQLRQWHKELEALIDRLSHGLDEW